MEQKTYPVQKLFFKYIEGTEFASSLHAEDVADCFSRAGLIELSRDLTRYHYTEQMRKTSLIRLLELLDQYRTDQGKE